MSLLLSVILLPAFGSLLLFLQSSWNKRKIQQVSLFISYATFVLSLLLWLSFDNSCIYFQFTKTSLQSEGIFNISNEMMKDGSFLFSTLPEVKEEVITPVASRNRFLSLIPLGDDVVDIFGLQEIPENLSFFTRFPIETFYSSPFSSIGLDGISLFFILLTTFLIPVCLLVSGVNTQVKEYYITFLLLESLMLALFSVLDLLLFYIFFESVLIPLFVIIGVWGSRERKVRAAYQFFLYTLTGSLLMLLSIGFIYLQAGTLDLQVLYVTPFTEERQLLLWCAFFASFAVKVPMVPVHIWLPEAHVEAPTAGSVLLAGIMLKLGTYGFLRFSIPLFPYACQYFTPLVSTLSVLAIIYTSLTTLRQVDLKKIIAYSSVAHMNFVTLGLFSLNAQGIQGSILLMISHGLVSPALFLIVGALYDRHKTRLLRYYTGFSLSMPILGSFFVFFTMANISLPGLSSFVGEFLVLTGTFQSNTFASIFATTGIVFGAAYALWVCNRVIYGYPTPSYISTRADLSRRETAIMSIFAVNILILGIYPQPLIDGIEVSVGNVLQQAVYSY